MTEREYLIALSSFIAFGPNRLNLLINYFGSPKKVWVADAQALREVGLSVSLTREFLKHRQAFSGAYFSNLDKLGIRAVLQKDIEYPENLKQIEDAPFVLYVKGKLLKKDANSVAIVGTRKMTAYGREVTQKLAGELASLGLTIVSGLAFGIDITAHKSALDVGGRCIAVLASGVDEITPKSNEWLGIEIIKSGGALISEYPPGTAAQKYFFPYRNRIVSGLSKAVIVVEGLIKSGTILTANHAANQGRQVFAVPGQITSPMSGAAHYLLKNGAKLATDVKDILDDLDLQLQVDREAVEEVLPGNASEEMIINYLKNEPLHLDDIARIVNLRVEEISARLTIMELKGMVKNVGGGIYKKV